MKSTGYSADMLARVCTRVDKNGRVQCNVERASAWLAERGVPRTPDEIAAAIAKQPGARALAQYLKQPFVQLELFR